MTKQFCDRCGELVSESRHYRGARTEIVAQNKCRWVFSFTIDYTAPDWRLCRYCAHELMDQAYKQISDMRDHDEPVRSPSHNKNT